MRNKYGVISGNNKSGNDIHPTSHVRSSAPLQAVESDLAANLLLQIIKNGNTGSSKGEIGIEIKTLVEAIGKAVNSSRDDNSNTFLHMAILSENLDRNVRENIINELINSPDIDLSVKNKEGDTPLHLAIFEGPLGITCRELVIKVFMEKIHKNTDNNETKKLLNKPTEGGCTLLHLAILGEGKLKEEDRPRVLSKLISLDKYKRLIDPNALDKNNGTPLHAAILAEGIPCETRLKIIGELLKINDIDVNKKNHLGNTPLHAAILVEGIPCETRLKIIGELLDSANIDLSVKNKEGDTPLHLAIFEGPLGITCRELVIKVFMEKIHKNTDNNETKKLLNKPTEGGCTLLHLAILGEGKLKEEDRPRVLSKLISLDKYKRLIDPNALDKNNGTPLHAAILAEGIPCETRLKIIGELLKINDIDVNKKNHLGNTSLHATILVEGILTKTRLKIINELLDSANIDLSVKNKEGDTPLHLAIFEGPLGITCRELVIKVFMEKIHKNTDNNETKKLLNKPTEGGCTLLHLAILGEGKLKEEDRPRVLSKLISLDKYKRLIDPNALDKNNGTPLHAAILAEGILTKTRLKIIGELLKINDIDVNKKNHLGNTPLHAAISRKKFGAVYGLNENTELRIGIVKELLNVGNINVHLRNGNNVTPLQIAQSRSLSKDPCETIYKRVFKTICHLIETSKTYGTPSATDPVSGSYADEEGAPSATDPASGLYADEESTPGATSPVSGSYADEEGTPGATDPASGLYADEEGVPNATDPASGLYADEEGAPSATDPVSGLYADEGDTPSATDPVSGSYADEESTPGATSPVSGSYADEEGAPSATDPVSSSYADEESTPGATDPASGLYADEKDTPSATDPISSSYTDEEHIPTSDVENNEEESNHVVLPSFESAFKKRPSAKSQKVG